MGYWPNTVSFGTVTGISDELVASIFRAEVAESIIIIIFIYCNWVFTRWQWLFYMYTKHEIGYY